MVEMQLHQQLNAFIHCICSKNIQLYGMNADNPSSDGEIMLIRNE